MNTEQKSYGDNYKFLLTVFTEEEISERWRYFVQAIGKAVGTETLPKIQIIGERLDQAVKAYFTDLYRMKEFYNIDITNRQKIYGYSAFWLLRWMPIQLIGDEALEPENFDINQRIIAKIFTSDLASEVGLEVEKLSGDKLSQWQKFVADILDTFKYRGYTQRSLQAIADSFIVGHTLGLHS